MDKKVLLLRGILEYPEASQRSLASLCGVSLGTVNRLIKKCISEGLITKAQGPPEKPGREPKEGLRQGPWQEPEQELQAGTRQEPGQEQLQEPWQGSRQEPGYEPWNGLRKEPGHEPQERARQELHEEPGQEPQGSTVHAVNAGHALTGAGKAYLEPFRVEAALIMAAGFGSRFVPLSFETPKGLLEVLGEPMVERQIRQLKEAGIDDIAIVVGYMKERFEYLTDKYGCKLIYNPEYSRRNNISTIHYAFEFLKDRNAYILSSDNWIRTNIYHGYEAAAWYSAVHYEGDTSEWVLVTDSGGRITDTYPGGRDCDCMLGPAYFSKEFSAAFLPVLERYYDMPGTDDYYWEHVLMEMLNGMAAKRLNAYYGKIPEIAFCREAKMYINLQAPGTVYEFENLEELRNFDPRYMDDSGSFAMQLVSRVFSVPESSITRIRRLKAGMTNNSWLFDISGRSYICRIPGEGTDILINRREEKAVFDAVKGLGITEKVVYFDADTGYKISEYYEGSRCADLTDTGDMERCMGLLKSLHSSGVSVEHSFDIAERLGFYEELCGGTEKIPFADYREVRARRDELLYWLEEHRGARVLSHIDPVSDNFLFLEDGSLKLIDWEYAGMCDPMIDIGMCAIYSFMDEAGAERLMEAYFGRRATAEERIRVYAYMALGGLLWALWGVYKELLGVDFTDYTIKMYRYFKKYSAKVTDGQ